MFGLHIFSLHTLLMILIVVTTLCGDRLVDVSKKKIHKAIFDNATHSIIGGLVWAVYALNARTNPYVAFAEISLCMVLASIIDLDHFLVAKSLYLEDATNLSSRPPLHCTTLGILIVGLLLLVGYVKTSTFVSKLAWVTFAAVFSHHTRDATRRGYWLYPFGSTPPLPYGLYITITLLLPFSMSVLIGQTFSKIAHATINI